MRYVIAVAVVALMFAVGERARAQASGYRLQVDGLACPYCAYGIERKLREIRGVKRVEIDLDRGTVIVFMAYGTILNAPAAERAVSAAGYTMRGFEPPGSR